MVKAIYKVMGFGKRYKWYFLGLFNKIENKKAALVEKHCRGRGLNVGCGASKIGDVGLDYSKELLELSPIKEKIHGDAHNLPFEDNSFEWAYCSELLHHADNPERVVSEMFRVAKKVVIIEANIRSPFIWCLTNLLPFDKGCKFFNETRFKTLLKDYRHKYWKESFLFMPNIWFIGVIYQPNKNMYAALLPKKNKKGVIDGCKI